ncbi:MAG: hypothetical protein ACREID_09405, partial [Planctomycetota bacterium]
MRRGTCLLLLVVSCRLAPASALRNPETRALLADRMVATLSEQEHYFRDSERRRSFESRLHE